MDSRCLTGSLTRQLGLAAFAAAVVLVGCGAESDPQEDAVVQPDVAEDVGADVPDPTPDAQPDAEADVPVTLPDAEPDGEPPIDSGDDDEVLDPDTTDGTEEADGADGTDGAGSVDVGGACGPPIGGDGGGEPFGECKPALVCCVACGSPDCQPRCLEPCFGEGCVGGCEEGPFP